jgi:predicted DNA-binding transcriptional regulator AlpA
MSLEHAPARGERLRTPEAARYTGISVSTLTKLRIFGGGPVYLKCGRAVIYDTADLDSWMASRKRHSTADAAHAA